MDRKKYIRRLLLGNTKISDVFSVILYRGEATVKEITEFLEWDGNIEKNAKVVRTYLSRLSEKGIAEQVGEKDGKSIVWSISGRKRSITTRSTISKIKIESLIDNLRTKNDYLTERNESLRRRISELQQTEKTIRRKPHRPPSTTRQSEPDASSKDPTDKIIGWMQNRAVFKLDDLWKFCNKHEINTDTWSMEFESMKSSGEIKCADKEEDAFIYIGKE